MSQQKDKEKPPKTPLPPPDSHKNKTDWWKDPIVISTIVIAIATSVNLAVSWMMWGTTKDYVKVTRDIFKASNRAYIGVFGITSKKDEKKKALTIQIEFKNFGTVPARDLKIDWDILINGASMPKKGVPDESTVLMPQTPFFKMGQIGENTYDTIINGHAVLEVVFNVKYKSVTDEIYSTSGKARYREDVNAFVSNTGNAN